MKILPGIVKKVIFRTSKILLLTAAVFCITGVFTLFTALKMNGFLHSILFLITGGVFSFAGFLSLYRLGGIIIFKKPMKLFSGKNNPVWFYPSQSTHSENQNPLKILIIHDNKGKSCYLIPGEKLFGEFFSFLENSYPDAVNYYSEEYMKIYRKNPSGFISETEKLQKDSVTEN
ncbi:MAG: hypothetical protein JXR95_02670 [Deltaproteobacteria bacterium]|nr:hypothetical protein [Deltaproteobacteria bacterium]